MSIFQKLSVLEKLTKISTNSYSGYFPNEALKICTDSELMVYSSVQFLSFYGLPVTIDSVKLNTSINRGTVKNCLLSLKKKSLLLIKSKQAYFTSLKTKCREIEITARELAKTHLGYIVPIDLMRCSVLSNSEKKLLSVMISILSSKGVKRIDMDWLGDKLGRDRRTVGRVMTSLVRKRYLSRKRFKNMGAYVYERGENLTKEGKTMDSINNLRSHENVPCNRHENVTLSIIDHSINNNKDLNNNQEQILEQVHENSSLNFLRKELDNLDATVISINRKTKEKEAEVKALNEKFVEALVERDLETLSELRTILSLKERDVSLGNERVEYILGITSNFEFARRNEIKVNLSPTGFNLLGQVAKRALPRFESKDKQKSICCLLLSSMVYDYEEEFFKAKKFNKKKDSKSLQAIAINAVVNRVKGAYQLHWRISNRHGLRNVMVKSFEGGRSWVD